jgi:hypothetical protein
MRDTQLCLLQSGGADLVDVETDTVIWASDSDEEFGEEFPELLDENDIEHLQDYLEEKAVVTSRELEVMEIITEPLESESDDDGDDDDRDDGDDEDDEPAEWDDSDIVDGEVIEDGDV